MKCPRCKTELSAEVAVRLQRAVDVPLRCSFCGKTQNDVRKLITGPVVYICNECVELCNDIIAEEWEAEVRKQGSVVHVPGAPNPCAAAGGTPTVEPPGPLQVRHTPLTPGDVPAELIAELRRNDYPYVRFYRTKVTNNTDRPIRIVWFDGFFWAGGGSLRTCGTGSCARVNSANGTAPMP